jgi:hypothetical protein
MESSFSITACTAYSYNSAGDLRVQITPTIHDDRNPTTTNIVLFQCSVGKGRPVNWTQLSYCLVSVYLAAAGRAYACLRPNAEGFMAINTNQPMTARSPSLNL